MAKLGEMKKALEKKMDKAREGMDAKQKENEVK